MNVIVTDAGFGPETFEQRFVPLEAADGATRVFDLPSDADPDQLPDIARRAKAIRIAFPSFADGRGFTLARRLRLLGFQGRLRAHGHVLADQYAMARRAGFDEVEIDAELAARQPEAQWRARADWQAHDYRTRLLV
ncbi:MAG: DUF934 domain-containing protein [Pseudomonadota bacterium]